MTSTHAESEGLLSEMFPATMESWNRHGRVGL